MFKVMAYIKQFFCQGQPVLRSLCQQVLLRIVLAWRKAFAATPRGASPNGGTAGCRVEVIIFPFNARPRIPANCTASLFLSLNGWSGNSAAIEQSRYRNV